MQFMLHQLKYYLFITFVRLPDFIATLHGAHIKNKLATDKPYNRFPEKITNIFSIILHSLKGTTTQSDTRSGENGII